MALEFKLREFTVDEYHRLAEIGMLRAEERVELLDGAIVEMSPIGNRHWDRHARISAYLVTLVGDAAFVVPQGSFPLGDVNEPQPDIALLAPRRYDKPGETPTPQEIHAVIELAESSLPKDTGPKLRLYSRFGIPDYLVVDLEADVLLHYRDPHDLGYREERRLGHGDTFTLQRVPAIRVSADPFLNAPS